MHVFFNKRPPNLSNLALFKEEEEIASGSGASDFANDHTCLESDVLLCDAGITTDGSLRRRCLPLDAGMHTSTALYTAEWFRYTSTLSAFSCRHLPKSRVVELSLVRPRPVNQSQGAGGRSLVAEPGTGRPHVALARRRLHHQCSAGSGFATYQHDSTASPRRRGILLLPVWKVQRVANRDPRSLSLSLSQSQQAAASRHRSDRPGGSRWLRCWNWQSDNGMASVKGNCTALQPCQTPCRVPSHPVALVLEHRRRANPRRGRGAARRGTGWGPCVVYSRVLLAPAAESARTRRGRGRGRGRQLTVLCLGTPRRWLLPLAPAETRTDGQTTGGPRST
jgi:hypothetical protein